MSAPVRAAPRPDAVGQPQAFLARSPRLLLALALALFLAGFALRLVDFTDPPLDFHGDRQISNATIARGMYYQMQPQADPALRQKAIAMWHAEEIYEPKIFERIVALTYLMVGGEHLWIARLYAILFWMAGGVALFQLARRFASDDGALAALAVYLFLPFGVIASRAFQTDPFMLMWILLALWALVRWEERRSWGRALAAAALTGVAVLVKPWSGLYLGAGALALALTGWGFKAALRDRKVWAALALAAAIPLAYYLVLIPGRSAGYFTFWTLGMGSLRSDPGFYLRWVGHLRGVLDFSLLALALGGLALLSKRGRALAAGLWLAYFAFGLLLPYQIATHDYYSLPLVPIAALSVAGLADVALRALASRPRAWQALAVAAMLFALAYPAWVARSNLLGSQYRGEPAYWQSVGAAIPPGARVVALTQADGYYLRYYAYTYPALFPDRAAQDLAATRGEAAGDFAALFAQRTAGRDVFLVTAMGELDAQPELKAMLFDHYPVLAQGDGFLLFDLTRSK